MITRHEHKILTDILKKAGWEKVYSFMSTGGSGSLYIKGEKEFTWTPETTREEIFQLVNSLK